MLKGSVNSKSMFFNIARHASFHTFFEKVRVSAAKLEIDNPRRPRKRKVSNHYE